MKYRVEIVKKVKLLITVMLESGTITESASKALNNIYTLIPQSKQLSSGDWKEIELHYQILLSELVIRNYKNAQQARPHP